MNEQTVVRDALHWALDMARANCDETRIIGYGVAHLTDGDGKTKQIVPFHNLVTDVGDLYCVTRLIAAITPASPSDATKLTGMQIGTNTATAPAKSGAGGALAGTLLAGQAFDATYPQAANLGGGLGVNAVYVTTYAAGTGTGTVGEAVLTNTATLGTASLAATTFARAQLSAGTGVIKGASDALTITWNHKLLGA